MSRIISGVIFALLVFVAPAAGQRVSSGVPPGFEALEPALVSLYDVYLDGARLGAFEGRVVDGRFAFSHPELLVAVLPTGIDRLALTDFLDEELDAHLDRVCGFGRSEQCGFLEPGESGVIVDSARFRADLIIDRQFRLQGNDAVRYLPDPAANLALMQNVSGVVTSSNAATGTRERYGITLDTSLSRGRNSFFSTFLFQDQEGVRGDTLFAQHIADNWRLAGGLNDSYSSTLFQTFSFYGADWTNRISGRIDDRTRQAPLDIVLPRRATVEIFRAGFLVSSREYNAGYVILDTSALPAGSYPVRIVARAGETVLLDEERWYAGVQGLPPEDRALFSLQAGVLAGNGQKTFSDDEVFPEVSETLAVLAEWSRRVGPASAIDLAGVVIDDAVFASIGGQTFWGEHNLALSGGAGSDDSTSLSANMGGPLGNGRYSLGYQITNAAAGQLRIARSVEDFHIFGQDRSQIYASFNQQLAGGNLTLSASRSAYGNEDDVDRLGLDYTRPLALFGQSADFTFSASEADTESRLFVGIRFNGRINERTSWRASAGYEGVETAGRDREDSLQASALIDRRDRFASADVTSQLGLVHDRARTEAYLQANLNSARGSLDGALSVLNSGDRGELETSVRLSGRTGWAWTPGFFQLGVAGYGDGLVVSRLANTPPDAASRERDWGYTMRVDGASAGRMSNALQVASAVSTPREHRVGLQPFGAAPFEVDLANRTIPVFPGNIVLVDWGAVHTVTIYGRLVDAEGRPMSGIRLTAGQDITLTGELGHFVLTPVVGEAIEAFDGSERICLWPDGLSAASSAGVFERLGDVVCY